MFRIFGEPPLGALYTVKAAASTAIKKNNSRRRDVSQTENNNTMGNFFQNFAIFFTGYFLYFFYCISRGYGNIMWQ